MTLCDFQNWVIKDATASLFTGAKSHHKLPLCFHSVEKPRPPEKLQVSAQVEKSTLILFTLTFVHYFWVTWLSSVLLCSVFVDQEWSWQKDNVFKIPVWLINGRTSSGMLAKHILEQNIGQGPLTPSRGKFEEKSKQKFF